MHHRLPRVLPREVTSYLHTIFNILYPKMRCVSLHKKRTLQSVKSIRNILNQHVSLDIKFHQLTDLHGIGKTIASAIMAQYLPLRCLPLDQHTLRSCISEGILTEKDVELLDYMPMCELILSHFPDGQQDFYQLLRDAF